MLLRDIRDYVATLEIAHDERCYCGIMTNKPNQAIGIYPLKQRRDCTIPIGGMENKSYGIKAISFLVHWDSSPTATEVASIKLHNALLHVSNVKINKQVIQFVKVLSDEPISIGMDDNGIHEYVVECLFYYRKGSE